MKGLFYAKPLSIIRPKLRATIAAIATEKWRHWFLADFRNGAGTPKTTMDVWQCILICCAGGLLLFVRYCRPWNALLPTAIPSLHLRLFGAKILQTSGTETPGSHGVPECPEQPSPGRRPQRQRGKEKKTFDSKICRVEHGGVCRPRSVLDLSRS